MSKPITVLRDTHPLPVLDACKWEKLEGDPHTVNLNATGRVYLIHGHIHASETFLPLKKSKGGRHT